MYKFCILILFVISAFCQEDSRPTVTLLDDDEVNATTIYKFHADVPKVDVLPFKYGYGRCYKGVWIQYPGANFTGNGNPLRYHNDCATYSSGSYGTHSLRLLGDPTNYSTPAVSFFTKIRYDNDDNSMDPPNLRLQDDPNLGGKYASFILNGDQPITFYSSTNFEGMRLCVEIDQYHIATLVWDVTILGITPDMLKSFRFGCHSKNIVRIKDDSPIHSKPPSESSQTSRPTITLYNNINEPNATYIYKFHAYVRKLDYIPFENESKFCYDGTFLVFEGENYTGNLNLITFLDTCFNYTNYIPFHSIRVIGDSKNYSIPAVSFFTEIGWNNNNNTGELPFLRLKDDPDLGGKYASFILNGDQPITLFSSKNYEGMRLCILPKQENDIATSVKNVQDLGIPPDMIKSFQFGCHTKNIARIKNTKTFK